jgi:UDP-N-acetylmuramate dehydrogenase
MSMVKSTLIQNQTLSKFTSLRVGGAAEYFCEPCNVDQLLGAVSCAKLNKWPLVWLGGGTNVLIHDQGVPGLVLRLRGRFSNLVVKENFVIAEAGLSLPGLVKHTCQNGLLDLSFCAGIPGTCGGAVYMNAGTKNGEISQKVAWVELLNPATGDIESRSSQEMGFAYRSSILQKEHLIVMRVGFRREDNDSKIWWEKARAQIAGRRKRYPQGVRTAGSFFKNPPGAIAGILIERAGLKGTRVGDAMASTVHGNFLVNVGQATSNDFARLIKVVRQRVLEEFGIRLVLEVRLLGFSEDEAAGLC